MPKKVEFNVIYVTSEDPKYKSIELNAHGPTVKGWQSIKNPEYPQELVLQLETRCALNRIQILAHQFLIPSRIELFSSNEDTNTVEDVEGIVWDYLGYITLSDNQSTGFKSRELKSANVPTSVASFVKLKLGNNHVNSHNTNNQVSLIAINVLGNEPETCRKLSNAENVDKINDIVNDPDYLSPYDDLAFEMYVDVDVAKIIRDMELKKRLAVISERFEYARKLKQAMEKLREAGEKLGKYELEKRHAIELEDYERARHKKNQMDEFRSGIYIEISLDQLLETQGHCAKNDECNEGDGVPKANPLSPTLLRIPNDKRSNSPQVNQQQQSSSSPMHLARHQSPKKGGSSPITGSPTNLQTRGSFRRRNKSAGAIVKSTYEMYEDKPLPTLRHSQTNEFLRECQMESDYKTTSKLTEREKKQAALPILVFGSDLVEKYYSKHYCDKEDGLNRLKDELVAYDNTRMHTANKTARAAIFLLHRTLRDKVFSVYNLANEVIRLYFVQFVPGRVSPTEVARSVDKLLPELLTKSGDTSARINHMAVHTILTMADCQNVRDLHIIPSHLSRPVSSSTHPRLALSRAEMVEQLILSHGISTEKQRITDHDPEIRLLDWSVVVTWPKLTNPVNVVVTWSKLTNPVSGYPDHDPGLTCRTLSEFGSSGLHHPAEAVRKVSERILVLVYKVNPRMVRKQLPPDDDITRRNLLYRQLFHEFDRIDMQRKNEMIEKTRVIQQLPQDYISPEPTPINKCPSTSNIQQHLSSSGSNIFTYDQPAMANQKTTNNNSYPIAKSLSGGHINNGLKHGEEKHSSSSASGISTPSNASNEEKQCIFCNQSESGILSVSNSMNSHYWRCCPMLVRCKECSQVVEVSSLTEHLLMECEKRENYTQCSQCSEAVPLAEIKQHLCRDLAEGCNRCPLCHENLEDEELCWKKHLMGEKPCLKNTRVKQQAKQVKIQI